MKPFVKAVVSGNEFLVVSSSSDGVCFSRFKYRGAANQKRNKINAAFESRLKEEMEKFRGREVRAIESEEVDAKDTQEESDFAYNRALRDAIHAIRSLPLFVGALTWPYFSRTFKTY